MSPKNSILTVLVAVASLLGQCAVATSLCATNEKTMFACDIGKTRKTVSICSRSSRLIYRYGTTAKLEMSLPEAGDMSSVHLTYQLFPTGEVQGLAFVKGIYTYAVEHYFGGKPPEEFDMVTVYKNGEDVVSELHCTGHQTSDIRKVFDSLKAKGMNVVEK